MKKLFIVLISLVLLGATHVAAWKIGYGYAGVKQAEQTSQKVMDDGILWDKVQLWRLSQNVLPYVKDEKLCTIAASRAHDIKIEFKHDIFEKNLGQYYAQTNAISLGENLSRGGPQESTVLNSWLGSLYHKENLTNPKFTHSCMRCSDNYCVQIFAGY